MRPSDAFRLSVRAIRGHELRSTLTTLGIVIGVGAVITFVILGASLQAGIIGDVGGEEAATINVWAGPEDAEGGPGAGAQPVFTERDVERLASQDGVESVAPYGQVPTTTLTYRDDTVSRSDALVATVPSFFDEGDLAEGRLFDPGEREAVLNPAAADGFEENVSAGDELSVALATGERVEVTVVGILGSSEARSAFEGFGESPRVYVPTDPVYPLTVESPSQGTDQRAYALLFLTAEDHERVDAARENAREYLETESDARELAPSEYVFELRTNEEILDQLRDLLDTLTAFVTGIAVISLIVGAIGIANIMLVSVTERTREIGIMKAVGARNRDVLLVFLTESVVLGVVGAVFGTLLGVVGGYLGTRYVDLPLVFPVEWFAVAVAVGVLVGVVAGLYPAWDAARTDPIDALRYE